MSDVGNPYAPPRAQEALEVGAALELSNASRSIRFLNLVIDLVVRGLLGMGLGYLIAFAGFPLHEYVYLFTFGFTFLTLVLYYVILEGAFGFTIGKLITRTRVVDESGRKPRLGQILGRTLSRFVPFEPFSFFNDSASGWHDRWSGTRVVRLR
jgi:uncharacterized RDD family membrane protein YckC